MSNIEVAEICNGEGDICYVEFINYISGATEILDIDEIKKIQSEIMTVLSNNGLTVQSGEYVLRTILKQIKNKINKEKTIFNEKLNEHLDKINANRIETVLEI
ncbi:MULTISPECIES: hypothetical protein [unclassified Granulicatella]|uniref:hypothetical protein n=1 Tax=unclassified Granulicatella TaxID=2630493 RepID=UPI00107392AA|nr:MULTISPECIES: hypothetical protein [unclassified Granulicatella]MBF0781150.1 hypothetical protein [Granulicatella sp. 19428wC4_WM01]TFU91703.1 hypothetical protein E4T68_08615 [Granulicatella sp. WM01]